MPFGGPGGDLQPQAMLQVFLNHTVFGMSMQEAVEAPRFVTHSFPGSFEPHPYHPGRLDLERGIGESPAATLEAQRPPSRVAPRPLHRDGRRLRDRWPTARRAFSTAEPTRAGPPARWDGERRARPRRPIRLRAPGQHYSGTRIPWSSGGRGGGRGMGPQSPFRRATTTQRPRSGNGSPGDRYGVGGGRRTRLPGPAAAPARRLRHRA